MDKITLAPINHVEGVVTLPGSKSASNRALLLSAFARGETTIKNLVICDDTDRMIEALQKMGVSVDSLPDRSEVRLHGLNNHFLVDEATLYLGNAGTAIRPLSAAVCLGYGTFTITGDGQMHERPIRDLVNALDQLGAKVEYLGTTGFPPLRISATGITGTRCSIAGGTSSQYLTALLMLLPMIRHQVWVDVVGNLVSRPYIDLTMEMMSRFGVDVEHDGYESFTLRDPSGYVSPGEVLVEGDASSATYFLSAAAIRGGTVRVKGVGRGSVQGDARYAEVLERMGARVTIGEDFIEVGRGDLVGIEFDGNSMPDAAMTLATTALFARGETRISNIRSWRYKETDRIAAVATELRKVGATVDETEDSLRIIPPTRISPATIDTYSDHRMAMCFSLAALGDATITINDPSCVAKTFPEYFDQFASITS